MTRKTNGHVQRGNDLRMNNMIKMYEALVWHGQRSIPWHDARRVSR